MQIYTYFHYNQKKSFPLAQQAYKIAQPKDLKRSATNGIRSFHSIATEVFDEEYVMKAQVRRAKEMARNASSKERLRHPEWDNIAEYLTLRN